MASDLHARLGGARSSLAFKAPCRVATTANITLSGFQTIDGITLASGDTNLRVLVKDQTNAVENGIYEAASGAWSRARDFDGSDDAVRGTRIYVTSGTVNGDTGWVVSTADPITIDTTSLSFSAPSDEASTSAAAAAASAAAAAASATTASTQATAAATSASAASTSATSAASSASAAATSASSASTSASAASTSASAAATSASSASSSASAASSSASAAATSAANAAAAAGFTWTFDSTTTMSAPSTGGIRFNNATLASVTAIAVHAQTADSGNPNVLARLVARDDSTDINKGQLLYRVGTSTWVEFKVTALTDNTTWVQFTVEYVGSAGSISNGNTLIDSFSRTGNAGSSSGDVTAANPFGTDNVLVRSDGTGKGVQPTGISVTDGNVVSGLTRLTASHTDYAARFVNTTDAASFLEVARFEGDRATPGDGDSMQIGFYLSNDAGTQIEAARMTWTLSDVSAGTEDSALFWMLQTGGSPENFLRLDTDALSPASSGLLDLGTASLLWGNLHQSGYHDLTEMSAPSSPSANVARVYAVDSQSKTVPFFKDSAGVASALDIRTGWVQMYRTADAGADPSANPATWVVRAPDGSYVSTTSTTTQGVQEALNYIAANGYNLFINGGGGINTSDIDVATIHCTSGIDFPPMFKQAVVARGVTFNFGGTATYGFKIDSMMMALIDVRSCQVVVGTSTYETGVWLRPRTANAVDPAIAITASDLLFGSIVHGKSTSVGLLIDPTEGPILDGVFVEVHEPNGKGASGSDTGAYGVRILDHATHVVKGTTMRILDSHGHATASVAIGSSTTNGANIHSNHFDIHCDPGASGIGIDLYGAYNSIIARINDDEGTATTGINIRSSAVYNHIIAPRIEATTKIADASAGFTNLIENEGYRYGGSFFIGTLSSISTVAGSGGSVASRVQFHSTGADSAVTTWRWSNDTAGPRVIMSKSRGTSVGTHTVVASGDILGEIVFAGADGTDMEPGAAIRAEVNATPGAGDMPAKIVFSTTSDGAEAVTDRVTIDSTGLKVGSALVKTVGAETIWIPAVAMVTRTTNGAEVATAEGGTNRAMYSTLNFDTTTQEYAQFVVRMPKSWNESTVTAQFAWSHPSTSTNFGVVFGLQGAAVSDTDSGDPTWGTGQTAGDTGGTNGLIYVSPVTSAITIAGTPAAEDLVYFQVYRDVAAGGDTMAVDARLHGITLYFTTDASTDA